MALETGTFISDLVATNPVSGDNLSQSDDHHRLLKSTILNSFPNITGALTASHTVLNALSGRVTAIEADYVADDGSTPLTGTWDASAATWSDLGIVTTADINGGSIDGTIIGAAAAAAGSFAALVGTTLNVSGAAEFASTVLLAADPTLDLQAATKQYVDSFSHAPVTEYINGLTLANDTIDANDDITIAAGKCADGAFGRDMVLATGLTKRIDAAWAVGTNAGMMDTGSVANSTWYHVFLIERSDTGVTDVLCSLSPTSPTMPANYDYKRRIGAIYRESAKIIGFIQTGDDFRWKTRPASIDDASTGVTTALTGTLDTPTGIAVLAEVTAIIHQNTAGTALIVTSLEHDDVAATTINANVHTLTLYGGASTVHVKTDTARTIRYRADNAGMHVTIVTTGWADPRGRTQ